MHAMDGTVLVMFATILVAYERVGLATTATARREDARAAQMTRKDC